MTWRPDRFELWFYGRLEPVLHAVACRRERAEMRRVWASIAGTSLTARPASLSVPSRTQPQTTP